MLRPPRRVSPRVSGPPVASGGLGGLQHKRANNAVAVKDTLDSPGNYLCQFASKTFAASEVRCRPHVPPQLPAIPIPSATRYNPFLAVKEALANATKHAHATEVELHLQFNQASNNLRIEVRDNGQGFDPAKASDRHGLTNIRSRLADLGGRAEIQARLGEGTRIILSLRLDSGSGSPGGQ